MCGVAAWRAGMRNIGTCAAMLPKIDSRIMFRKHFVLLAGLITFLAAHPGCAQPSSRVENSGAAQKPSGAETGKLGDPAPPLTVMEWIKGRPVKIQPGTNIYVLVFCTLSRANEFALTNLDALQQDYQKKGVVVVAISADPPQTLKEFVQARGGDINFTVAADDIPSRTANTYQHAFKQMLLPRAYVVGKDAKVLWFGHPLRDDLGLVVDKIIAGRYDLEREQKKILASEQMEQYLAMARDGDPRVGQAGRILLTLWTNDAPALCNFAFQIATAPYIEKRDVAVATSALDRAAQLATTNAADIAVDRAILLFQTGEQEAGLSLARKAMAVAQSDDDKGEVRACIRAMEARIAAEKSSRTNNASTNSAAGKP